MCGQILIDTRLDIFVEFDEFDRNTYAKVGQAFSDVRKYANGHFINTHVPSDLQNADRGRHEGGHFLQISQKVLSQSTKFRFEGGIISRGRFPRINEQTCFLAPYMRNRRFHVRKCLSQYFEARIRFGRPGEDDEPPGLIVAHDEIRIAMNFSRSKPRRYRATHLITLRSIRTFVCTNAHCGTFVSATPPFAFITFAAGVCAI
jgi:hypothetical protein